jgi:hypothetical protein
MTQTRPFVAFDEILYLPLAPVVHDDHLEPVTRICLPLQALETALQPRSVMENRNHDRDEGQDHFR